ncbi:MAG: hypothetical protein K6L81_01780 [Agarilytica sp.]
MNKTLVTQEEAQNFITDLTAVCEKHDLWIGSCGCCNSPWANRLDGSQKPVYSFRRGVHPIERIQVQFKHRGDGYPHDPEKSKNPPIKRNK